MGARALHEPRLMQILPRELQLRLRRPPERAIHGRGLPGRPRDGAAPHRPTALDLSRPVGMYPVKLPGER